MLLNVQKMTCGHCVRTVTNAVRALDSQAEVEVDLADGSVRIDGKVTGDDAAEAIREEGYTVQVVQA